SANSGMDFDIHIRGAGIGGLLPAYVWTRKGLKVVVTDPVGIGAGASGAWRTLLNPASGVNPRPMDGLAEVMTAFGRWMEAVDPGRTAAKPVALYRPATDAGLAAGFRAAAARHWEGARLRLAPPPPGIAGQEG